MLYFQKITEWSGQINEKPKTYQSNSKFNERKIRLKLIKLIVSMYKNAHYDLKVSNKRKIILIYVVVQQYAYGYQSLRPM